MQKRIIMPGYRGHLVGGMVIYSLMALLLYTMMPLNVCTFIGLCIATCAGALFPDIDTKSKGQRYFYWIIVLFLLWSMLHCKKATPYVPFEIVLGIVLISLLPLLGKHRGYTHKPWVIIVLGMILWLILSRFFPTIASIGCFYVIFFVIGALSHIWLDRNL